MTLAEIKRRIKPGTVLRLKYSRLANSWKHKEERALLLQGKLDREVVLVQTNAIAFRNAENGLSWLYWPKASEIVSPDNKTFSLLYAVPDASGVKPINLTYEFLGD